MTTTAPVAGSTPAPKNLVVRFIGILTSPKDTFQAVAAHPKWLGMLLLIVAMMGIFTALPMTTEAGKQAAIDMQDARMRDLQQMGITIDTDRIHDQMVKQQNQLPVRTGVTVAVIAPIVVLIMAGVLFAIFNAALGGEATFKQLFSTVIHASVITATGVAFSGLVNFFRGGVDSVMNLGALLPMLPEKSFVAHLLGNLDVFRMWWIIVVSIGLGVLYRRRTQPIAVSLFAVYAVYALVLALVQSRMGG